MLQHWRRVAVFAVVFTLFATLAVRSQAQEDRIPRVWSIMPIQTTSADASFVVTFSEDVTGVDLTDFRTSSDTPSSVTAVRPGTTGARYTVDVATESDIMLILSDDDSIANAAGIPLGGAGTQNGNLVSATYSPPAAEHIGKTRARLFETGAGTYNALALTDAGNPVVLYYDKGQSALKLAHCTTGGCGNLAISTLSNDVVLSSNTTLALTSDNIPVLAFIDGVTRTVIIAICDTLSCANPSFVPIVQEEGLLMPYSSPKLALTSGNVPVLTYVDSGALKYVRCNNPACASFSLRTLRADNTNQFTAMALTSAGIPYVAYTSTDGLGLTTCDSLTCASPSHVIVEASPYLDSHVSMQLNALNIPTMSYYDYYRGDLKIAVCSSIACISPTIRTIDSAGAVGLYVSMALTTASVPVMSYYDATRQKLKFASCADTSCSAATVTTLDNSTSNGTFTSLVLTTQDSPIISYVRETASDFSLQLYVGNITVDDGKPGNFNKSAPLNQGIVTSASTILSWDPASSATSYEYCAVVSDSFCSPWTNTGASTSVGITGLLHGKTYHWQVRAKNSRGITVADTTTRGVFTVALTPTGFSKTSPANAAIIPATTTRLAWDSSTYAAGYEYCFYPSTGSCTRWISTGLATSVDISGLDNLATYLWSVRATNAGGSTLADSGVPNRFTITLPPTAFSKMTPIDNATIPATTTTLSWGSSALATAYEYCVYPAASSCSAWTSTGSETSVTLTGLTNTLSYAWAVRATNAGGTTVADSGTAGHFTVVLPPVAFAKSAPANNALNQKISLTLSWGASTFATSYEYCIGLTTTTCTTWNSTGTARVATVSGLLKAKTYYWQVRAKNLGGTTVSSSTFWKFTTAR